MNTQLTPFWYTPEGQSAGSEVQFHLRPLSQPQLVDVEQHNVGRETSRKGQWVAGTLGIIAVKGASNPRTQEPAAVPECFQWLDRNLVRMCGLRLIMNDVGVEWEKLISGELPGTEPQDDPVKN